MLSQHLNIISIDSLKLRIPISRVTVISDSFNSEKHIVNVQSGDIEDTFKDTAYPIKQYGISTRYGIERMNIGEATMDEYLTIMFNSKILRSRYFEGINSTNITVVYDAIMNQGIVEFMLDDMLKGIATDCDFKMDFLCSEFDDFKKSLVSLTKVSRQSFKGCMNFNRKDNKGIQWSDRKKGTPSNPYLKIYHKQIELSGNSTEFNKHFLGSFQSHMRHLVRSEFTIKNKKHFSKYKLQNDLKSILTVPQSRLKEIQKNIFSIHLQDRKSLPKKRGSLTPSDCVIVNSIFLGLKQGSYQTVKEILIADIEVDKSKRRMSEKMDDLYEGHVKGTPEDKKGAYLEEVFEMLGI